MYTRAILFSFFFPPSLSLSPSRPIETCFFRTEFLEQFVTIPAVLSPVCNIEILQLVWNFQCFSGETSCGSKIRYLIRESAIIMIFIAWTSVIEFIPSSFKIFLVVISSFYVPSTICYSETYWHEVLLFSWITLVISAKNASLCSLYSIYVVTSFTSIGPTTTIAAKKPTSAIQRCDWGSIYEEI